MALWRKLDHLNIVKFLDCIETPTHIFVVCELCEEGCLNDYVINTPDGLLSEAEARPFFVQIVNGLRYLHSRGIYHGDVKLDNILLNRRGEIKLCDFGFSESVAEVSVHEERTYGGTLLYCAPEVLRGGADVGLLADVWSAGVTLYALVTGELPFDDDYEPRLKHKILSGKFAFPTNLALSAEVKDLITSMLKTSVSERLSIEKVYAHPWFKTSAAL